MTKKNIDDFLLTKKVTVAQARQWIKKRMSNQRTA